MGFSWAIHFAQGAHKTICKRALPRVPLLLDRRPPPPIEAETGSVTIYADNAKSLGTNASVVNSNRERVSE
eukprot:11193280-Lingulodinium_polyedra.AAC.1